jgi:iron(III) transport system ATP-binding protein
VLQFAAPGQLYREPADPVVAGFIGEGMVVPVDVVAVAGDGTCEVDLFGYRMRMRCGRSQTPRRDARACLRASALRIVAATEPGVRAHVDNAVYQGGHFRIEAGVEARPGTILHLSAREPSTLAAGDAITLALDDGWVIPAAPASG